MSIENTVPVIVGGPNGFITAPGYGAAATAGGPSHRAAMNCSASRKRIRSNSGSMRPSATSVAMVSSHTMTRGPWSIWRTAGFVGLIPTSLLRLDSRVEGVELDDDVDARSPGGTASLAHNHLAGCRRGGDDTSLCGRLQQVADGDCPAGRNGQNRSVTVDDDSLAVDRNVPADDTADLATGHRSDRDDHVATVVGGQRVGCQSRT